MNSMDWTGKRDRCTLWELALMAGVLTALFLGAWLGEEQQGLADSVIRLHVIAESDSAEDQALKLKVRDRVLETAEALYPENTTLEEAKAILSASLPSLARAGQDAAAEAGSPCPVTASLEECWFPTKTYDSFALPAGRYTALRVVIGEGKGKNWWCVAFPPLCLGSATESVEEAAQAGLFTRDQVKLITEDGSGYILKFRALELLGALRHALLGDG